MKSDRVTDERLREMYEHARSMADTALAADVRLVWTERTLAYRELQAARRVLGHTPRSSRT